MKDSIYLSIIETTRSSKKFFYVIVAILIVLYCCSGIYSISQNEMGVLERFGKIVNDRVMPGIHFVFPWPIDRVYKVPMKMVQRITIDDFQDKSPLYNFYGLASLAPYCITGDNNIVNISCRLQYSIFDPVKYLFSVKDSNLVLHSVACNTIIHCLASLPVDKSLTFGKREIEIFVKNNVQKKLDAIGCGLIVSFVELKKVSPPAKVQKYFDDVINSKIDKKKMISNAESYWNEKIPQANALARQMVEQARAYQKDVVAKAEGDSARFLDTLSMYKEAKQVTRDRLYLRSIKDILSNMDEVYIVSNNNGTVPAVIKLFKGKEAVKEQLQSRKPWQKRTNASF